MSKMNTIPASVQQVIESLLDGHTPEQVKFNNKTTLENIIDCCQTALKTHEKKPVNWRK